MTIAQRLRGRPPAHGQPDWSTLAARRAERGRAERVWRDFLAPELARREGAHTRRLVRAVRRMTLASLVSAMILILAAAMFQRLSLQTFPLACLGGVIAGGLLSASDWIAAFASRRRNKELILGAAAASFGFEFDSLHEDLSGLTGPLALARRLARFSTRHHGGLAELLGHSPATSVPPTPGFASLETAGLLPDHDRKLFEDLITGARGEARFSVVEARLDRLGRRSPQTVFRGLIIHVRYPRRFSGRTLLARRGWWKYRPSTRSLEPVDLNSVELARSFAIHASDQVEARTLLTPERMARLMALEARYAEGRIRGVFEDGHMTLAVEGHNRFEAGTLFGPLVDPRRFTQALEEIETICDVVDAFVCREWPHKIPA
ncbi:MAG: DUF3137 domain-containing protein [Alphaproteobacteria bacterium]|jgi:hypothetical protein|nr:DUF3137 domain-containing protein [Alphaproteobacteria bacterium]